jgi:polysaccharide pyruvyl transferase WcaK-like protein
VAIKIHSFSLFFLISHFPELDQQYANSLSIKIVSFQHLKFRNNRSRSISYIIQFFILAVLKYLGLKLFIRNNSIYSAFNHSDLILDLSGDSYKDYSGGFSPYHNLVLLFAMQFKKKVILISQSIGPFRSFNTLISRFVLNRVDYIYLRESETLTYLQSIKVKVKYSIAPDLAFALPFTYNHSAQCSSLINHISKIDSEKQIIIVSVSKLLFQIYGEEYWKILNQTLLFIDSKKESLFVFVPHDIKPGWNGMDDRSAIKRFLEYISPNIQTLPVYFDFDPSFIKQLSHYAAFGVCGRMHAGIALLSSNKPCLFMGWSYKYKGLLDQLDQDYSEINLENTISKNDLEKQINLFLKNHTSNVLKLKVYNSTAIERITNIINQIVNEKAENCTG